jgi:hypothetical protein
MQRRRWTEREARMGEKKNVQGVWLEYLKDRDHLQDLGLDWKIILKGILKKQEGSELDLCGEVEGQMAESCEH